MTRKPRRRKPPEELKVHVHIRLDRDVLEMGRRAAERYFRGNLTAYIAALMRLHEHQWENELKDNA